MAESSEPPEISATPLAVLPPPPPVIPPWAKVLYYVAEGVVASGIGYRAWHWAGELLATGGSDQVAADTWRRFSFKWEDMGSQDAADDEYFTIDVANVTGGAVDGTWTSDDYNFVVGALDTMSRSMSASIASRYRLTSISAYVMAYRPYSDPKPFADTGPPEVVYPFVISGGATPTSAPQVSSTVTEMVPLRSHWGRFYLPTIGTSAIDNEGRLLAANVSAIAAAAQTCYEALYSAQFVPVVAGTRSNKQPLRALMAVTGIRVDDVLDVQRSRRHKHPISRSILPVAAQTLPAPDAT